MAEEEEKFALLIIDPQVIYATVEVFPLRVFCLQHGHIVYTLTLPGKQHQVDFHGGGALAVSGADEDAARIRAFILAHLDRITSIYVTLDSHQVLRRRNKRKKKTPSCADHIHIAIADAH